MSKISELLRWKKKVDLVDEKGNFLATVYLRVIGDTDLQEAYKLSRLASSKKRAALRNVDTIDYQDEILTFKDASEEECKALIKAARGNNWVSEAYSVVVRPDEVKLSEVAIDPDAPTLEEQEKLDIENKKIDDKYQEDLDAYMKQKEVELDADLATLDLEALRVLAQVEATQILPLTVFINELQDEKTWRACYNDKEYKERAFTSLAEFRETKEFLRNQLIAAYQELEVGVEQIKN